MALHIDASWLSHPFPNLSYNARGEAYNLFEHNCNTFSNEVAQFLTGRKIPSYITDLPSEVLSTPFGQALRPLLDSIQIQPPGGNAVGRPNGQS
ncbi:Hypothetical predicted protein [Marmota monax]|uniref:palmitoyl-protein hydrolase n=1 Tax=Marmota monax TaxID=9995 RepID=A0A5E4D7E6_MARMO|nr:Hypothetical predicted protein [Marmota monax]